MSYGGVIAAWNFPQTVELFGTVKEARKPENVEELNRPTYDLYSGGAFDRFVGYPNTPPGTLQTYRLMDCTSPTLTLIKASIIAPIVSADPTFHVVTPEGKKRPRGVLAGDGVQTDELDKRADLIEQIFSPLWPDLMFDCCRSLSLGHYPFEVIWEVKNGRNWIKEFVGLPPEWTAVLVDKKRRYLGIRPMVQISGPDLIGWNSFNCVYDCEARNHHGRPRHENARQEWWRQLQDDMQGSRLDDKSAGFVFSVAGPDTSFIDDQGNSITGKQAAQAIAQLLAAGRSVYLPNFAFSAKQIVANPDLAAATAFSIKQYDLGNVGPSQAAILNKLEYRDKRLVRAWCRPEREILESSRGGLGQGDSSVHGQVGIVDSEMVMGMFYRQINAGPVDDVLRLNFGPEAVGSVVIAPPPLADPQVEFLQKVILALMADQQASQEMLSRIDIPTLLDRTETPSLETPKPIPAQPQQQPNVEPTPVKGKRMAVGAMLADRINGKSPN